MSDRTVSSQAAADGQQLSGRSVIVDGSGAPQISDEYLDHRVDSGPRIRWGSGTSGYFQRVFATVWRS